MATSTCPKCGRSSFEVKQATPLGSNFYLWFVQCSFCGAVVASQEADNIGALLADHKKLLKDLESRLERVEHLLRQLVSR